MNARWTAFALLGTTLATLGGCGGGGGSSASAPTDVTASAGDGRVVLSYTEASGVNYWVFIADYANLTRDNAKQILTDFDQSDEICGLRNTKDYWFAVNGRKSGGEGGDLSNIATATPRSAGDSWASLAAPAGATLNAIGYTYTDYCRSYDTDYTDKLPGKGFLMGVGDAGLLRISSDYGTTWTTPTLPSDFTANLYAAGGDTHYPSESKTDNKDIVLVAVGAQGAALYSTDGSTWKQGRAADASQPDLHAVGHSGTTIIAVGDSGTALTTSDGKTWSAKSTGTTENLYGVEHGSGLYVAVGANGTLLTASSTSSWSAESTGTTATLRSVAYGNFDFVENASDITIDTFVAVGDNGTVLTSTDGGSNWQTITPFTSNNLVSVGYTTRFVAVDSAGNSWTSTDGLSWSAGGATGLTGVASMVSTGGRYIASGSGSLSVAR